ncbi:MAG: M20/M25/M40 family metallo-hydrolase [Pseudomonadales bacterium]|jgi:acetylornithine deacetylase/succinyl-diaminopimelate desuccinylase-like protein|nr:M20/M25/M40 family metallo-hydrolase [Pseudomonadales bacterium]MDP6470745.1 M20/M25/M40 family metallo-hydrolase [Pseudomonadales bacterium]MDP6828303.1 M20/M25/M40 family metallo-hydrolase [Pseudomonadales bacterium]MDP6972147.1 M20/M25/M40 family metallo-hydrolase [Pseudomonadales bacterium]|tara:strand:- start:1079 stop:2473 length:1395 start_codon:yes stop_codon:yes gene_type:complete
MKRLTGVILLMVIASQVTLAEEQRSLPVDDNQLVFEVYKQLIETNTTHSVGDNTLAAQRMAAWLSAAGFADEDVFIGGPKERKGNLVARLHGTGERKPLILLAHLDVVEAKRSDWSMDPFTLHETDGYYYGRGTLDDKAQAAIWTASMIRMMRDDHVPDRDIILALTADEEGGGSNGVYWLLENHPQLIGGAFALNEGGFGLLQNGTHLANNIQTAEKIFQSYTVTATNPGGHSSIPRRDNAIYELAEALIRIREYEFPVMINDVMKLGFSRLADITPGQLGDDLRAIVQPTPDPDALQRLGKIPYINALLRTTAVATMLDGGHARNALPQSASAEVNVRMMPGTDPEEVLDALVTAIDNPDIKVVHNGGGLPSDPSPLTDEILNAVEAATEELWPGVPVIPTMVTGATDGAKMRNAGIPTYGVSGLFVDRNDIRAHGRDERILVTSFYEGYAFMYSLVLKLSS